MSKSLLEQLPGIVAAGKRQAAQILEQLEGRNRVSLHTRELVIPSKDHAGFNFWGHDGEGVVEQPNRLIYGDNLLALAALLAGDDEHPSLRGRVDLITSTRDRRVAAPHQAETTSDRLLKQDRCLGRPQRHDDRDVAGVEAVTKHEH